MRILLLFALCVLIVSSASTYNPCKTDAECTDVVVGGSCCFQCTNTIAGETPTVEGRCYPLSMIEAIWNGATADMKTIKTGELDCKCTSGSYHHSTTGLLCTSDAECADVTGANSCCLQVTKTLPDVTTLTTSCNPISTIESSWTATISDTNLPKSSKVEMKCKDGSNRHYT